MSRYYNRWINLPQSVFPWDPDCNPSYPPWLQMHFRIWKLRGCETLAGGKVRKMLEGMSPGLLNLSSSTCPPLGLDDCEVNDLEGGISAPFLRVWSSSTQVASLALTLSALSALPPWLPLLDRNQGGNAPNFLPDQTWQWRHGWAEAQDLLPMAATLHKTDPHTVENSSLLPICGIPYCGYQSFIRDIKLNESTGQQWFLNKY